MKNTFLDYAQSALIGAISGLVVTGFAIGTVQVLFRFGWAGGFAVVAALVALLLLVIWLRARKDH